MRIVLDTTILLRATESSHGPARELLLNLIRAAKQHDNPDAKDLPLAGVLPAARAASSRRRARYSRSARMASPPHVQGLQDGADKELGSDAVNHILD